MKYNKEVVRVNQYDRDAMIAPFGEDNILGFRLDEKVYLVYPKDMHNDLSKTKVNGKMVIVPLRAYRLVGLFGKERICTATGRLVKDSELLRRLGLKIASDISEISEFQ